jgi:sulfur-oxidizing protein SoxX
MRLFAISIAACILSVAAAQAQPREIKDGPLVAYTVVDYAINKSLTGKPGDVQKGRALSITSGSGNCVICHKLPIPEVAFRIGNVGPDLTEVADRLTEGEIRLRIVNPKLVSDETIMPAYYRIGGLNRVQPNAQGKPMLTPEQVEDLVAYLMTMKPK